VGFGSDGSRGRDPSQCWVPQPRDYGGHDGATGFSQFISGREINAASAFKFYVNVVLIGMGLKNCDPAGSQAWWHSRSIDPLEQR
jgi:hypothetical protein